MNIETKLKHASQGGGGAPLTWWETSTVLQAIEVLRRVSENQCTNPQREAADILARLSS